MKIKSLYISAQEKNAGTLFVSMGMMEILKRKLHRVAFFRPIIFDKNIRNGDIDFILQRYNLDMNYEECYGFDIKEVEEMISKKEDNSLITQLIDKFKKLEREYDFVLCEGIRRSFLTSTISYDLNVKIAQNFAAPTINIIKADDATAKEIYENMLIENEYLTSEGCTHFATFVNRVDDEKHKQLQKMFEKVSYTVYLLKEVQELNLPTIDDVIESLGAKEVMLGAYDHARVIKNVKVAALTLDNFLEHIEEEDLIIVPADRSDIILGLFGALHSSSYPNISAIIFPFSMKLNKNIQKLIAGLNSFKVPILSVDTDTFETATNIMNVHSKLRVNAQRKIALALGLFNSSVNIQSIEEKIATTYNDIMTPQMFEYKLFFMASQNKKRIVLPESSDERILRAAEIILRRDVADIIFIGDEKELKERYMRLGLDLSAAQIVNHLTSPLIQKFTETFYELRKHKGLTKDAAKDAMLHVNYFATMMVYLDYADGMVSGANHATADTIRPALQIIKTKPGFSVVSSVFFMCLKTKVLVYGDCALNQDPDAPTLAEIAIASAQSAKMFGIEPKIAMLSYSTGESGHGFDVDKVREATKIVQQKRLDLLVEGPIQYDAAIDKSVAKIKLPHSKVAGEATVFIFPDLNTGNNTYKAVQRSSGAIAIGPVLQGLKKPVNDLSRGCFVEDIVNTVAITAIQAGENE
ncbi:phosphate acetyltransferase [Sulfurimonas autotrophica]|uniref:Phosphate acetyltransferase n=1 Tax=Sulfurimonas autotrophica (strain ATCC BAA-671 / DSM 16294 / JCM 11897 / OK10) TaxID=563040 RepID=E0UQ17_SULAO|nr:phosphate acetyltransferase [Sulfurimonas autotrophica]ADN08692.1 phosphotransacetylase [Sulfurimonas autotrophica DSM 16294]